MTECLNVLREGLSDSMSSIAFLDNMCATLISAHEFRVHVLTSEAISEETGNGNTVLSSWSKAKSRLKVDYITRFQEQKEKVAPTCTHLIIQRKRRCS